MKGSRFLTHMKKLKDPEPGLENFFSRVDLLKEKLAPILFQLPPKWELDHWRNIRSLARAQSGLLPVPFGRISVSGGDYADIKYIRLHGPGGRYQGSYDDDALGVWVHRIADWRQHLRAIYVYFDNDDSGFAARDAARLREMVAAI